MRAISISIEQVIKETEKAILFDCNIRWKDGYEQSRSFWVPRSAVVRFSDKVAVIKEWFIARTEMINKTCFIRTND